MKEKAKNQKISRRNFLKTSASTASLAALSLGIRPKLYAAGRNVIRIGLIGCGGRGAGAVVSALTVNPNAKLTAMAEAFGDRLRNTRKNLKNRMKNQVAVVFSVFSVQRIADSLHAPRSTLHA